MSTLLPESKPCALHIVSAAATQSGAPFGAFLHFSWPTITRALEIRETVFAASLAPSTVVLAATPASRPKLSNFLRTSMNVEFIFAAVWSNQRTMAPKKLVSSFVFGADDPSCATASADIRTMAPANRQVTAGRAAACLRSQVKASLVPIAGQADISSVA